MTITQSKSDALIHQNCNTVFTEIQGNLLLSSTADEQPEFPLVTSHKIFTGPGDKNRSIFGSHYSTVYTHRHFYRCLF